MREKKSGSRDSEKKLEKAMLAFFILVEGVRPTHLWSAITPVRVLTCVMIFIFFKNKK